MSIVQQLEDLEEGRTYGGINGFGHNDILILPQGVYKNEDFTVLVMDEWQSRLLLLERSDGISGHVAIGIGGCLNGLHHLGILLLLFFSALQAWIALDFLFVNAHPAHTSMNYIMVILIMQYNHNWIHIVSECNWISSHNNFN